MYVWLQWNSYVVVESMWQDINKAVNSPTPLSYVFARGQVPEDMSPEVEGLGWDPICYLIM